MKHKFLLSFLLIFFISQFQAQVAINTTGDEPNANAMLDVSATAKGVLIPRISTTDRTGMNLTTTEDGLVVYDTDTKSFWYWNGNAWNDLGNSAANEDQDWLVVGSTEAPTSIDDSMFHAGNVTVGKDTTDVKLYVYEEAGNTAFKVDNLNSDTSQTLRVAGYFNVGGAQTNTNGKIGVFSTVGGNPGDSNYASLIGIETDVVGDDDNTKPQYGVAADISGDNSADHMGAFNYLHGNGDGSRYGVLNYMAGNSNGLIIGVYDFFANSGSGIHMGAYRRLYGSGDGIQYAVFNRIGNSGSAKHIGVVNELKTTGASSHTGTMNVLGAGVPEGDPTDLQILSGDSDGKRLGTVNVIAGDGGGLHIAESNNIFSTGDGFHIGVSNVLGHNYLNNTNTATDGYQLGILNNLTDTGGHAHVGASNLIGFILNPTDPMHPSAVTGDSSAMRIGAMNTIGGDGAGQHYGIINTILSTGAGEHVGTANAMGYDFANQTATTSDGDHVGTLNSLNDLGSGIHYGTVNFIGYDHINHTELNSNGMHYGTVNFLAGGQTNGAITGLQVGTSNVILTNTDATKAPFYGKQMGAMNIIGYNPNDPNGTVLNNGDGLHIASYNEVADSGNGLHIASYNKVRNNGSGTHIAVYGEVEDADDTAMAGVFKGDVTARNYVTVLNILAGQSNENDETIFKDLPKYNIPVSPTDYIKSGSLEVRVVAKISNFSGNQADHSFRLRAIQSTNALNVISDTETWNWEELKTGTYMISTEWKSWDAGVNPWLLSFQVKNADSTSLVFNNVYIMVRPSQNY